MTEIKFENINMKLDDIMTKRNTSTYGLNSKTNVRFQTIKALRENKATRIDFNVLAKLCYVLKCKVEDLTEYKNNG